MDSYSNDLTVEETVIPPSAEQPPPDSEDSSDSDEETLSQIPPGLLAMLTSDVPVGIPGIPDTVDASAQDSKTLHPLLRPRTHAYTLKELRQILASDSMQTLPISFMPTGKHQMQPPVMCYGWELVEDKLLEYAEEIGVREYAMYCCNKEELKGRNIDPANILEPPRGRPPGTVGVRVFSPLRTMEELFAVYLDVLDIDTCLINPIRAVYTPEGRTTRIYTFYTNYHCDDAPTKPQLEALRWAMDEFGLSRELKWWFSLEDPHWRTPFDPWPLR